MKIASVILFVVFVIFAALQYNDTDPWLWMLIYGYTAAIPLLYLLRIYPVKVILVSIVAGFIFSIFYIPGIIDWIQQGSPGDLTQQMKATKPYIEQSREFLGLFMALLTLLFYYIREKSLTAPRKADQV